MLHVVSLHTQHVGYWLAHVVDAPPVHLLHCSWHRTALWSSGDLRWSLPALPFTGVKFQFCNRALHQIHLCFYILYIQNGRKKYSELWESRHLDVYGLVINKKVIIKVILRLNCALKSVISSANTGILQFICNFTLNHIYYTAYVLLQYIIHNPYSQACRHR